MQEDLYAKICSLSYMGDLRMLFAEDRNKVKEIVRGQYELFQTMYKPFIQEYETKELLRYSLSGNPQLVMAQVFGQQKGRCEIVALLVSLLGVEVHLLCC